MTGKPRYLLLGDTHGSLDDIREAVDVGLAHGVDEIIQLGDCGVLWPGHNRLDWLNDFLDGIGMRFRFIDGNHDWHPEIRHRVRAGELRDDGSTPVSYIPRGAVWQTPNGTRVGCIGGAPSIDRRMRTQDLSWWAEEFVDPTLCEEMPACDVLLTHDSPVLPTPIEQRGPYPGATEADLRYCALGRECIQMAVQAAKPRRLYHGHYHCYWEGEWEGTKIVGLANNSEKGSIVLVDESFEPIEAF